MSRYKLKTQRRDAVGKNRVDKLRNEGIIPGVVYHKGAESENVQVDEREFNRVFAKAGTSTLIDLDFGGETATVLIKEAQKHPIKDNFLNIDFQEVQADVKIRVTVPVILNGRDDIRVQPSILLQLLEEIEVECYPADIPQTAEVDVTNMQIGDVLTVADLDIAGNEKLELGFGLEEPVASLNEPREEVEPSGDDEEVSAADVPEIGKDKDEEEE